MRKEKAIRAMLAKEVDDAVDEAEQQGDEVKAAQLGAIQSALGWVLDAAAPDSVVTDYFGS